MEGLDEGKWSGVIRWTTKASADFEAIRLYIEADNPAAAIRQSDLILAAIDQLDRFPESGPPLKVAPLRQLAVPKTPYIIFYRLHSDAIILSGILHGAMSRPKHLRR